MSIHLSKHPNLYALHHTFINLRIKYTHLQLWQLYIYIPGTHMGINIAYVHIFLNLHLKFAYAQRYLHHHLHICICKSMVILCNHLHLDNLFIRKTK